MALMLDLQKTACQAVVYHRDAIVQAEEDNREP